MLLRLAATAAVALALAGCGGSGAETSGSTRTAAPAAATPADALVRTSEGSFTIRLAAATSPNTVASFERLVREGFFDGTVFHRIVPGFVIQGGDPTGSGSGGPGYATRDVPPASTRYTRGVVAMAKAQNEPPGTAGSQFFVVTGADVELSPEYAILGKVTAGLDVVERIGRLGDPQTELPTKRVVVRSITLAER